MYCIENEQLSLFEEPNGINDADIDKAILIGSGFEGGRVRIAHFFKIHTDRKEQADFLRDEYGVGGMYPCCKGHSGMDIGLDHGGHGIRLYGFDERHKRYEVDLNWKQAAQRICQMMSEGIYIRRENNETT